jgi:hypothetical protein
MKKKVVLLFLVTLINALNEKSSLKIFSESNQEIDLMGCIGIEFKNGSFLLLLFLVTLISVPNEKSSSKIFSESKQEIEKQ